MKPEEYANNRLKTPKAFKTFCENLFNKVVIVDKGEKFETTNRKSDSVEEYTIRKNTNFRRFYGHEYVDIALFTSKRIEIQTYSVTRTIDCNSPFNETISIVLINLQIFTDNKEISVGKWMTGWVSGLNSLGGSMGYRPTIRPFKTSYSAEILRSEIRYTDYHNQKFYSRELPSVYKYRLLLETLKNLKGDKLYKQVISGRCDMRRLTKKFVKSNKYLIKTHDYDVDNILIYNQIKSDIKMNKENLELIRSSRFTASDLKEIEYFEKSLEIKRNRVLVYLLKNGNRLGYYKDYISMINQLNLNNSSHRILYPKNLTKAHNEMVESIIAIKRELEEKKMVQVIDKTKNLEYNDSNFMIIAPDELRQIFNEGKELHHCVGSDGYLNRHVNSESFILFLREKSAPNVPFYTIEYRNNKVLQIRGLYNASPSSEINNFVSDWLKHIKKLRPNDSLVAWQQYIKNNNHLEGER